MCQRSLGGCVGLAPELINRLLRPEQRKNCINRGLLVYCDGRWRLSRGAEMKSLGPGIHFLSPPASARSSETPRSQRAC